MFPLALAALGGCNDYGLADRDETVTAELRVSERFEQSALRAVDILFVVDATGSMEEEQAALAAAAGAFVTALDAAGLSWQLGVVSMDLADAGALLGRPWVLAPGQDAAAEVFAANLLVGTDAPPPSAGLDAAVMAIRDESGANLGFRRPDAALHVVFVSDGDDESGALLGDDPTSAFLAVLADEATRTGRATTASAVVGDVPAGCRGPGGTALPGARFVNVATRANGVVASVCDADLAPVAESLVSASSEYPTRFALQDTPAPGSVRVWVDDVRLDDGWEVDAATIVFDPAPADGATIDVSYVVRAEGA